MSRNRGVRGPNSALTEFLRNEGITDTFRRRQRNGDLESPPPAATPVDVSNDASEDVEGESSDLELRLSDGDLYTPLTQFGLEEICAECGNPFTLTVYSRFVEDFKGYICEDCNEVLKKRERTARTNQANARKRRKKLAKALLDKKAIRIASLQDVCIKNISSNIAKVNALGNIGQVNINKILKILSKNRSLDDSTVSLFLNSDLKSLELWDCSNVSSDSFLKIAAYCSNLEALTLFMCGQFHNDNLVYYKEKLPSLKKLALNGPFLISDKVWQEFFTEATCDLQQFEVRNTHRFSNDSLVCLLETRGKALTLLKLSRLDGLTAAGVYELIPNSITALESLELSYPHSPELISDDLLIHILAVTGDTLQHLNVDGCAGLTDLFLEEGIAKFCPVLELLSLRGLAKITDEGFAKSIQELSTINDGLSNVDLLKCIGLGDKAVDALLLHSGNTLVEASLNSLNALTKQFFTQTFAGSNETRGVTLPLLTKIDVGFVRCVDDTVCEVFSAQCPNLAIMEVFGDNKCTSKAEIRADVLVIGRQGEDF